MMAALNQRRSIPLSELLHGWLEISAEDDRRVESISMDSRRVTSGGLFLACAGTPGHGMDYFDQALQQGAGAVICETDERWPAARIKELSNTAGVPLIPMPGLGRYASAIADRFYGQPSKTLRVIGVTGTNGKTSCTQFIAQALAAETPCAVIGTLGNGFPGNLNASAHTTPDPVLLQGLLNDFRSQGAVSVAMEVSSHALDQGRAAQVRFETAVLTNLSRDHLDYHGTMYAYADAKRRLFQMPDLQCAIINLDDPFGRELLTSLPDELRTVGYSLAKEPQRPVAEWVRTVDLVQDSSGMQLSIESSWGSGSFRTPLLGRFNASNLMAVLALLLSRGISLDNALQRLSRLETVAGRMERFGGGARPLVVVDYAHTPDALEHALTALREHVDGRLVCLFGCGGDRDRGKRPLMGAIAERLADQVWVTDDNPRTEDGDIIVQEILQGMQRPDQARVERNRGAAIKALVESASADDLLLVAGKGHEDYQLVGDLRLDFSDREQVGKALAELRG